MGELPISFQSVTPGGRCSNARCVAPATHTPFLHIALVGSERVSRVTLPTHLCARHGKAFAAGFLTAARRASIERSLRAHGRQAPDWSRTRIEFA